MPFTALIVVFFVIVAQIHDQHLFEHVRVPQRPEVDAQRLGCAGLSVGGYRSFMLAALAPPVVAAAFRAIAEEEPDRFRIIDASGSTDAVAGRMLVALDDLL